MTGLKFISCITTIALAFVLQTSEAKAQPATVACGTAIDEHFTGVKPGDWLVIVGTRLTARGDFGFSAFTMQDGYNVVTNPIGTTGAANRSTFTAGKGSSHYVGAFHEVFPGRSAPDEDRTDFWVYRTGAVWLRSITWSGSWTLLQGVTCFRGPQGQTVVRGHTHTTTHGTDFWTFVITGGELI